MEPNTTTLPRTGRVTYSLTRYVEVVIALAAMVSAAVTIQSAAVANVMSMAVGRIHQVEQMLMARVFTSQFLSLRLLRRRRTVTGLFMGIALAERATRGVATAR